MSGKRATNQKALKESYRLAYADLSRIVEEADPVGLIAAGAPLDEYGPEVSTILAGIRDSTSVDGVQHVVHASSFGGLVEISRDLFLPIPISREISGHGKLGRQGHRNISERGHFAEPTSRGVTGRTLNRDGFIPQQYQLAGPSPCITGRAWICDGPRQEEWDFTLLLKPPVGLQSEIDWPSLPAARE